MCPEPKRRRKKSPCSAEAFSRVPLGSRANSGSAPTKGRVPNSGKRSREVAGLDLDIVVGHRDVGQQNVVRYARPSVRQLLASRTEQAWSCGRFARDTLVQHHASPCRPSVLSGLRGLCHGHSTDSDSGMTFAVPLSQCRIAHPHKTFLCD